MNNTGFVPPEKRVDFAITAAEVEAMMKRDGEHCRGFLFCTGWNVTAQEYVWETKPCRYRYRLWTDASAAQREMYVAQMNELSSIMGRRLDAVPVTTCDGCMRDFEYYEKKRDSHQQEMFKAKRAEVAKAKDTKAKEKW